MFEAVRLLKENTVKSDIFVHDTKDNTIGSESQKAEVIKSWFNAHYTGDEPALGPFEGEPRPVDSPITPEEV